MSTKRNYATIEQIQEYANITVTDSDEAWQQIEKAEEMIDAYVGAHTRFHHRTTVGEIGALSADSLTITDAYGGYLDRIDNYYKGLLFVVVAGVSTGKTAMVTSSSYANKSLTLDTVIEDLQPGCVFELRQIGKFPRLQDAHTNRMSTLWYTQIPDAVTRAVAAQLEYMINQGDEFFSTDQADKSSESIGNYSYSKQAGGSSSSMQRMIAPQAKVLLRGYVNRGGRLISGPDAMV